MNLYKILIVIDIIAVIGAILLLYHLINGSLLTHGIIFLDEYMSYSLLYVSLRGIYEIGKDFREYIIGGNEE